MLPRDPMRRVDAAWFHMDRPRNTADIVALMGFRERIGFGRIRDLVDERLLGFARFRQRIREARLGAPAWEPDPRFDLDRHLVRARLPSGAPDALPALVGEIATERLDPARPPWRIYAVEGPGASGSALVAKVHHCVGDGFALVGVLRALADEPIPEIVPAPVAYRDLSLAHGGLAAVARALRDPDAAARVVKEVGAFASSLARMATLPFDRTTVLNRPLSGVRRVGWTEAVPLDGVRAAARRAGATVNELVLAALSGALRQVLAAAGERVDDLEPRVLVPVNTRLAATHGALDNAFGLVFLDLPVRHATPAERLAQVHTRFETLKHSPDALVALAMLGAMGFLPPAVERLGTTFFARKAAAVVTNVPGPRDPLHLAGHELDRLLFWVPHPATLALGVSIFSYAGRLRIGVRADVAALRDPSELARALEAELQALGVPAPLPERASRRRARRAAAEAGATAPA